MIVFLRFLRKLLPIFVLYFYSFTTFAVEDSVSLQLKWKHQFQFAGFYAAQIKGFYSQENLHVNLKEFKYSTKIEDDIIQEKSEYGVTSSNIIRDFSLGQPLVVLSTIFQHSPYVIISLKGNAISKPTDLSGKKVVVADGLGSVILQVLLNREGIPSDSVKTIPYTQNLDLKNPNNDAITAYRSDKPYYLETIGLEYSVIDPSNYGVDFYGDVLFTSKNELNKHPQRVQSFLKASLKGWEYALDHPEEIAEYILQLPGVKERGLTKEMLLNEASVIRELIRPDLVEIGHFNKGRWDVILKNYQSIGLIDEDTNLEGFLYIPEDINVVYNKRLTIVVVILLLAGLISLIRIYYIKRNYKIQEKKILEFTINEKFNEDNINMILEHADISMWKWDVELDELSFFNTDKGNTFSKYNIKNINDFKALIHPEFLPKFELFITLKSHHFKEELLIKSNPKDENYN
jgi:ABC-type nitrate/sulfonate/bicarbonate transport system substrate-binding protein